MKEAAIRWLAVTLAALTVLIVALPARALHRPPPRVVAFWTRVQRCEEPVTGWGTRGSSYEGGVGFAVTTWAEWARDLGVYRRWPHAWMAPVWVQIAVAEWGWQNGGYWGTVEPHGSCAGWHP